MTYSIVARDPATGQMGVAVQSHWFSVGTIVTWAEAGVGVVATQALADPSYGPLGLDLLRQGSTSSDALRARLDADEGRDVRQVAMIDARGEVATHTGARAIAEAGHATGDQVSCQANMMLRNTVWDAMLRAYQSSSGDLTDRLLAALDAAETEGGDIRGKQSAALLVVKAEPTGKPWVDRALDVRVDDHAESLTELRRLVGVKRAYDAMNEGDELLEKGDVEKASLLYAGAQRAMGGNVEPTFWAALTTAASGRLDDAKKMFAFDEHPNWRELLRRLPASGLADEAVVSELLS
jgi:uncharacterized Ntn-hydrolase superfamily protein